MDSESRMSPSPAVWAGKVGGGGGIGTGGSASEEKTSSPST